MKKQQTFLLGILLLSILVSSCSKSDTTTNTPTPNDTTGTSSTNGNWFIDTTFKPTGSFITLAKVQDDGKIIIANTTTVGRISKDGTQDGTFTLGTVGGGNIFCIALQTDGKLLVGGDFTLYNSSPQKGLLRLNSNGSIDNTFTHELIDGTVKSILLQNSKIIIGGDFDYGSTYRGSDLIRLNTNGSYDVSFLHKNYAPAGTFLAVQEQQTNVTTISQTNDNRLLIGGHPIFFLTPDLKMYGGVVRLNSDGSIDTLFKDYSGGLIHSDGTIRTGVGVNIISTLNDGKIVVGGDFNFVGTSPRKGLLAFTSGGDLDNSLKEAPWSVYSICVMANNSFFVGNNRPVGYTGYYEGEGASLLKSNGDKDSSYLLNSPKGEVYSIVKENEKSVLIMGHLFSHYATGTPVYDIPGLFRIIKN